MAEESRNSRWPPVRSLNVSDQLQNLRNLLNSTTNPEHQRQLETIEQEISLRTSLLERQRRDIDARLQDRDGSGAADSLPTSSSPSSLVRSRRRIIRPSERLQRHRERPSSMTTRSDLAEPFGVPQQHVTLPPPFAENRTDEYGAESQSAREQRYRAKRRKLDDGTFDDETMVLSYGDEGRVTPGPLRTEIIQCDGGDHFESTTGSVQYVLQDDKNTYSTKENKCNILLKHIGGLPFSLTKIIIKAPSEGFDSPIQEGMIFVAMNDEKLFEKTSKYDRYYPKSYRLHQNYRRHDSYRPPQEYLNSSRPALRSIDRLGNLRDPQPAPSPQDEDDSYLETSLIPGFDVTYVDPSDHEDLPSFAPPSPGAWPDLGAEYSLRSYADRYRPGNEESHAISATSSESEDDFSLEYRDGVGNQDDLDAEFAHHRLYLNQMRMASDRADQDFYLLHPSRRAQHWRMAENAVRRSITRRSAMRSNNTFVDNPASHETALSKAPTDVSSRTPSSMSDPLLPHARFSMAETQTSIAINFDPPVAGRYILVKLWASCPRSNIDIQCIIPHGYGGPRFFPSTEVR